MSTRPVGWIALATLICTSLWLVLIITDIAGAGSLDTYEQVLAHVSRLDAAYYTIYIASGLLTVTTAMLMAGLYGIFRQVAPIPALFGVVFVPVYATLNLIVYFSQVTIVPTLMAQQQAMPSPAINTLLQQLIHQAPGSALGFANALAYAVLGIPSVIFGLLLWQGGGAQGGNGQRMAGLLLALSGALSMAGFLALFTSSPMLDMGLIAGGAIFWLALFPLSYVLLRGEAKQS